MEYSSFLSVNLNLCRIDILLLFCPAPLMFVLAHLVGQLNLVRHRIRAQIPEPVDIYIFIYVHL